MRVTKHHRHNRSTTSRSIRRGTFAPAAVVALVVVVSCVALVLDKLWLEAAQSELQTGVEAAALSAGRLLANDDLLRPNVSSQARLELARQTALQIAAKNTIAGRSVELDASPEGSIRFGVLVPRESDGETIFVETSDNPTSVVVTGEHTRAKDNPVALFWRGIGGVDVADVAARAEATVDNHVVAFRPMQGVPIPILPLAILKDDPKRKLPSWIQDIELRQGPDQLGFVEATNLVTQQPDGIPEIVLTSTAYQGDPAKANAHVFSLNASNHASDLLRHIQSGWALEDFSPEQPEFRLDRGPICFPALPEISGAVPEELHKLVGQCRIVLLYDALADTNVCCSEAVAGRILGVTIGQDGTCQIVFQPGVLTTRTGVLSNETMVALTSQGSVNKYVYKLQLTF